MPELTGRVAAITFHNEENLFTIARLDTEDEGLVPLLGNMGRLDVGESLRVTGEWESHPRFGRQFKVKSFQVIMPATADGIREYLGSGLIRGLGPSLAERIVNKFGDKTLDVMDENPSLLLKVKGIGENKLALMMEDWKAKKSQRETLVFLTGQGITPGYAGRIMATYGDETISVLRQNPYRLALEVSGIGFVTADAIGRKLGIPKDAPVRMEAGIFHALSQAAGNGHFYLPETDLYDSAARLVDADVGVVVEAANRLILKGKIIADPLPEAGRAVYLPTFHAVETGLARRLAAFLSVPEHKADTDKNRLLEEVNRRMAIELSPGQLDVLARAVSCRFGVITGGPGTGKTTLVNSIAHVCDGMGKRIRMAAPTGRAAKRLSEVTKREAVTIHRLLAYDPIHEVFTKNEENPLEADLFIIDEASMVDAFLMHHFMKAVPMSASVLLVGDVSQLPPVGPGNALKDIMASGRVPVFELTEIFRQAEKSLIVQNAHRVNAGKSVITLPADQNPDFFHIEEDDPERMVKTVIQLCSERIPKAFGLDPVNDIQVLTPMHKGAAGTLALNTALQAVLNPDGELLEKMSRSFKVGDKVMQLRNNYQKEIYNGDIGVITGIDREDAALTVRFDTGFARYDFSELDELSLAYATSVHKSQGSEYPAVVLLLSTSHYVMLQRNLLYTGITRARKLLVLVGGKKAVSVAISNDHQARRLTRLCERLQDNRDLVYEEPS